jgi:hypothetical protein
MASTHDSKVPSPPFESDEKADHVQRECIDQDETPEAIVSKMEENALRRKLDRYVAPVMMMLMLISYLDRGNIGFAATQGMTTDIHLKGSELNVSCGIVRKASKQKLMETRLPYQSFTSSTFSQRWVSDVSMVLTY